MIRIVPSFVYRAAAEPLEARIAPASLSFVDVDGDKVTITLSKGSDAQLQAAAHLLEVTPGHFQLQELSLGQVSAFQGANLTVDAAQDAGGDGFVNVGHLDAAGIDLGSVKIDGDLGRVDAGDSAPASRAISTLEVKSMGALDLTTQGAGGTLVSNIRGDLGALVVHGDIRGAQLAISGDLAKCDIEGSVIGSAAALSGSIAAGGMVKDLNITGTLQGGGGANSGRISGSKVVDATIGAGIVGGNGENSGQLAARNRLAEVTINGDIVGGDGLESGGLATGGAASDITIRGDIRGGSGKQSGEVGSSGNITQLTLDGSLLGSSGEQSGSIGTEKGISGVHITGNVVGSTGPGSGQIVSKSIIHGLHVDGSLIGGANFETGAIGSLKGVDDIAIGADIVAGTGERSGLIVCDVLPFATIGSVKVGGSIKGTPVAGTAGISSGGILSGYVIGFVEINGDILGGNNFAAGSVRADVALDRVVIHGSLVGGIAESTGILQSQKVDKVEIGKDLIGGAGFRSGEIAAERLADTAAPVDKKGHFAAAKAKAEIGDVSVDGSVLGFVGVGLGINGRIFSTDNIGTVVVKGDVVGGNDPGSGVVLADERIKRVTITGSLTGGAGDDSGVIHAGSDLGAVQIGKDVRGGGGTKSGAITSDGEISRVDIDGSLIGGAGDFSGEITTVDQSSEELIGLSVRLAKAAQGKANHSGKIAAAGNSNADIGPVNIAGDITGGEGDESGKVYAGGKLKSVTVGGDLLGGEGDYDIAFLNTDLDDVPVGQIVSIGPMGVVKIGGDVRGGEGSASAAIEGSTISSVVVDGSIVGGDGDESAAIIALETDLPFVKVAGEVVAGFGDYSAQIGAARNIGFLEVGALRGFESDGVQTVALITAGGVLSPNNDAQAIAIKKLIIDDVTVLANILAGYDLDADPLNPDASIGSVTVGVLNGQGSWTATDLVAGTDTGQDFRFGTEDDVLINDSPDVSKIVARIERIVIAGDIILPAGAPVSPHGIVAQQIENMKLAGANVGLSSGAGNDFIHVGSSADTTVVEVGRQPAT